MATLQQARPVTSGVYLHWSLIFSITRPFILACSVRLPARVLAKWIALSENTPLRVPVTQRLANLSSRNIARPPGGTGLSDEDSLELTYHVMGYNMHAVCCRALRLEFDDVPERIKEVPVPGEGEPADWAGSAWQDKD